jgi:hypothetical protein
MSESTPDPQTSILDSIKKALGIAPDYDVFDPELIMYINGVFTTLQQLGVGPSQGYRITGSDDQWSAFLGNDSLFDNVKIYMYLRVRLIFDPPATSFAQEAFKEQARELEFRMNVQRESTGWTDPNPVPVVTE